MAEREGDEFMGEGHLHYSLKNMQIYNSPCGREVFPSSSFLVPFSLSLSFLFFFPLILISLLIQLSSVNKGTCPLPLRHGVQRHTMSTTHKAAFPNGG